MASSRYRENVKLHIISVHNKGPGWSQLVVAPVTAHNRNLQNRFAQMNLKTIYTKTGKGMLEMKNKSLPKDISRVLTLIDGKSNVGSILGKEDKSGETKLREMLKKLEN